MSHCKFVPMLCLLATVAGCDAKKVDQLTQRVAAMADPHESLHDQMLDCEDRYCRQLVALPDMEAVKQAKPQLDAEIYKYRDLGERFLGTKGLTMDKFVGILKRSLARQIELNQKIKEQEDRLLATGRPGDRVLTFDGPPISWFVVKINFDRDVKDVAQGRPRREKLDDVMARMRAEQAAAPKGEERVKQEIEKSKARMEEARARMEAMRAKMGPRPGAGARP